MSDIPVPEHFQKQAKKNANIQPAVLGEHGPTVGSFFAEHRAAIDARKIHLSRVGMGPVEDAPTNIPRAEGVSALPSQRDVLAMPTTGADETLMIPTAASLVPETAPATYAAPKLPKLPGVNATLDE